MEKSDSIINLTCALIKAQGELEVVARDTQAYNYKYATLPAVFAEYKKCFLKHGLAVIQLVESKGLRTTLVHESGEWVSAVGDLAYTGNDPQAQGSAITYMRRYGMSAACGIMQEDDDGKKACPSKDAKPEPKHEAPKPEHKPASNGEHLRYIGHINERKEGKAGFVSYVCGPMELSTKMPAMIEKMDSAYDNKTNVQIDYTEVVNGRWTNRYIQAVAEVEDVGF